ncbi:MAG: response regulator transcription factor [Spirochaetales bacterium]|nr:response regulator transcription factor [Spirochaetales bacterium]
MARIFVVEDNEALREAVCSYLRLNDHEIVEFPRAGGVLEAVETKPPDLIVLDVMLPDGDGFLLARKIRKTQGLPIIFLTAKASESDRITGFELGADDYVVKPFSPRELSLRVEAVLRRSGSGGAKPDAAMSWVLGKQVLELDEAAHRASVAGNEINLTVAEWKILSYLATHSGVVVGRERLLGESLDYLVAEGSERTVDTHIKNLRAKLGSAGWIETVRGFGYRFSGTPQ